MSAEYAFRVAGRLTPGILGALDPLHASAATTETTLVGLVVDGAALHGFIARIEALGLELVELRRLPPHPADGGPTSRCPEWGCGDEDGRRRAAAAVASRRFLGRSHGLSLATAVDAWPPSGVRPAHILCGTIRSLA